MDLAKLVVRLEAQSAQLLAELEKANRKISLFERNTSLSLDKVNKRFDKIGFGLKASLGALLGAVSFKQIIDASGEAAERMASLENAVERAGDAAGGRTAKQFAAAAREIANVTTQTGGAVQNVQQLLLRFQNIRSDRFDEATTRVLDLSAALGQDLDTAAKTVGRALADPIKGVTALGKAGVVFSDSQKKLLKDLVESGRRAEAQGLILDSLAKKFGGAAEAARNNFGGALKGVKNALGDLLEIEGGLPQATESLNELAKTLQDPAVRAGADALFSVIVRGASAAAKFLGETIAGLAILAGQGQDAAVNLDNQIRAQEDHVKFLKRNTPFTLAGSFEAKQIEDATKKLAELREEYEKLMGLGVAGAMNAKTGKGIPTGPGATPFGAFELPDIEVTDQTAQLDELRKKLEAAGKALTESVQTPQEKYNAAVARADELLAANVITIETWARALGAARGELDGLESGMLEVSERFKTLDEQIEESALADNQEMLDKLMEQGADDLTKEFDKVLDRSEKGVNAFTKRAAENVQDILADGIVDGLRNGFEDGAKGALEAFADMLERMVAEAIAADIAGAIFGTDAEGVSASGSGGLFGQFMDWIGGFGKGGSSGGGDLTSDSNPWDAILNLGASLFTSMDSGGHAMAGTPVAIGRGAQPELFVPDTDGTFYPNGTWGGGGVTQNIYTSSPITQRSARQLELEAARAQRLATARFG